MSLFVGGKWEPDNKATAPVDRYATEYNMSHKNRGYAIIFNHENFADPWLSRRNGADVDSENLRQKLTNLQFQVQVYKDRSVAQITGIIEDISRRDHTENDCIVIAVLSHGECDAIHAYDDIYRPSKLWNAFTADACPSLAGKPKVFVIQACLGGRTDQGIELKGYTQTVEDDVSKTNFEQTDNTNDENEFLRTYELPINADFLVAYSTMPRFVSWRDEVKGSWFIQSLCEQLQHNGNREDLLTLLTLVNQKVAFDFQSNARTAEFKKMKQIPFITFTLTRFLTFSDKK